MAAPLEIRVVENGRVQFSVEVAGPVELGRAVSPDERLYQLTRQPERARLCIAVGPDDGDVSRQAVLIEPLGPAAARITNLGRNGVQVADRTSLSSGGDVEVRLPVLLLVKTGKAIQVEAARNEAFFKDLR